MTQASDRALQRPSEWGVTRAYRWPGDGTHGRAGRR